MADSLLERTRRTMPKWMGLFYEQPLELVSGRGCIVRDSNGREYLDFFAGILTTIAGHGVPEIVTAVKEQADRLLHTSTLYLSESMVALAEEIAVLSGIPGARVFFTPSGSEANDAALLLATSYRRSNQILAIRNSYHGRSFSATAITGNRSWSPTSLSGLAVTFVHGGYRLRSPFKELGDREYTAACVQDLRDLIDIATAGDVACLIAEPIQGVGGFAVPPDGFFGAMKPVLDERGILFISDEVQTGWGRTGEHFWGYQAHGLVPDLLTFAKGVANGMPLAGVVARREIMDCLQASSISTFGGNPLAVAAGRATIKVIRERGLQQNALERGRELRALFDPLADRLPHVAEVRGKGLMIGVEIVAPGGLEPDAARAGAVLEECRERGVLVGKGGLYGNVLRIAPPLSITSEEIARGGAAIVAALEQS